MDRQRAPRHGARDGSGRFSPAEPPRAKHTTSTYRGAQISPTPAFRPHAPGGVVTKTAGVNPDPPASRQVAPDISPTVPYEGGSPTGYDSYTLGTF